MNQTEQMNGNKSWKISSHLMRFVLVAMAMVSTLNMYAYQFTLEGTIGGKYPIVIEVDRTSNGAITGRYAYKSTLRKYGRDNKESWFYIKPEGSSNTRYVATDSKKKYYEYWNISMYRKNGKNILSGIIKGNNGKSISIEAASINGNSKTNRHNNILSLQSLKELSWKKPNEIISYLKSKGLKVKGDNGYMYGCELPNGGWITIFAKPMGDRMGIGPVEFSTTSRSQYNEWKRQLKAANYQQAYEDVWCGDTGHYFAFRLVDLLDETASSDGDVYEGDGYCGTATLCVSGYPLVYDENAGCYDEYEYRY